MRHCSYKSRTSEDQPLHDLVESSKSKSSDSTSNLDSNSLDSNNSDSAESAATTAAQQASFKLREKKKKKNSRSSKGASQETNAIFIRLAFQNLLRRPTRTFLLILAVAIGSGAVFSTVIVARGMQVSIDQSFARMGADLIVVPEKTMVNITSALLTVQPTDETLDPTLLDKISKLDGVAQAAPQTIFRVPIMAGMPEHKANLIAFDPARDFTVMPWLTDRLKRPMQTGDLISGGRRSESVGEEVQPCNSTAVIYGKLGRSNVGPFDESFFATYDTVKKLVASEKHLGGNEQQITGNERHDIDSTSSAISSSGAARLTAILVKLNFGTTPEQLRFAIANVPGIKVISGAKIVTATRETTTVLLNGIIGFIGFMLLGSLILVSLLFSAIISERRREIGLLRAIGGRHGNLVAMLSSEAALTTALGGICGIILGGVLLLAFQHSLVYYLQSLHVEFAWPHYEEIAWTAFACLTVAALVGLLGAVIPAWRASGEEPYSLIQGAESSC